MGEHLTVRSGRTAGRLPIGALVALWVLVITAVAVSLAVGAQHGGGASLAARTAAVASQVRCPVCDGLSVEESSAPIARDLRSRIEDELAAGESAGQVEAGLAARYGQSILLSPSGRGLNVLVWVVPLLAGGAGVTGLALFFWRRKQTLDVLQVPG